MNIKIKENIKAVILGLILTTGISFTLAADVWTPPDCSPPGCNASAPINVSDSSQVKVGKFGIGLPDTDASRITITNTDAVLQTYGKFLANSGALIRGDLIIDHTSKGAGKYLMSDADGKATWSAISGGVSGATVHTFNSSYYTLMNDSDFRAWFQTFPGGTALLRTEGAARRNDEGWTEPSEKLPRVTADKLCNFFTDGPSIDFTVVSLGSDNNNDFYTWDVDNNKWMVRSSTWLDARDISIVTCLALGGIKRGSSSLVIKNDVFNSVVCTVQKYNCTN